MPRRCSCCNIPCISVNTCKFLATQSKRQSSCDLNTIRLYAAVALDKLWFSGDLCCVVAPTCCNQLRNNKAIAPDNKRSSGRKTIGRSSVSGSAQKRKGHTREGPEQQRCCLSRCCFTAQGTSACCSLTSQNPVA